MTVSNPTYVIAEIGVNHNGDMAMAKALIHVAANARANAVKFQTFIAEELAAPDAPKASYQAANEPDAEGESQYQMLKRLELPFADHAPLKACTEQLGLDFLSTPFGIKECRFLQTLGLRQMKLSSGDLTNAPLLAAVARGGSRVILSTGMATLDDVTFALDTLAWCYLRPDTAPHPDRITGLAMQPEARSVLQRNVSILQCTTHYPCPTEMVHLRAMQQLHAHTGLAVGFSDHSPSRWSGGLAVAAGATIIEKHLTLDTALPGPDHAASLAPHDFTEYVAYIREAERMLGSPEKSLTPELHAMARVACKHLIAVRDIKHGEHWQEDSLATRRTGGAGLPAAHYYRVIGTPAHRDYRAGEPVEG